MTPTQTVLAFAAGLALITLAGPVLAEGGCWDDCGPVEPPPTVQPPTRTDSDRDDPLPQSRPLPCCVRDGVVEPLWEFLATSEGTLRRCNAALSRGNAVIYECLGVVSPEVVK